MATRLQRMILTLVCGTSLGLARRQKPAEVQEPGS